MPHTGITVDRLLLEFLRTKFKSNQAEGGGFCSSRHQTRTLFSISHGPLQAFLLASPFRSAECPGIQTYCLNIGFTEVYELSPLLKEQKGEWKNGEERWDPWINCHQFISFTGQSEACNAGWNWILVVVKHHKSNSVARLKVRNHFGVHGTCRMLGGAWRNCWCAIISKYGTFVRLCLLYMLFIYYVYLHFPAKFQIGFSRANSCKITFEGLALKCIYLKLM